jgi:hypothetical protein
LSAFNRLLADCLLAYVPEPLGLLTATDS